MPDFTIRVELQGNPPYDQYEALHKSMGSLGFIRSIAGVQSGKAVTVNLPTGLYFGQSNQTAIEVSQNVHTTASRIHQVAGVFVAQTTTWASN